MRARCGISADTHASFLAIRWPPSSLLDHPAQRGGGWGRSCVSFIISRCIYFFYTCMPTVRFEGRPLAAIRPCGVLCESACTNRLVYIFTPPLFPFLFSHVLSHSFSLSLFLKILVGGMNRPTIAASGGSNGACIVSGVPSQYDGGKEYTIKVNRKKKSHT